MRYDLEDERITEPDYEPQKQRSLIGQLLPRTLTGLAMWILLFAAGMAAAGVVLFTYYQFQLSNFEKDVQSFGKKLDEDFKKRTAEFTDLVSSSKAEIEKASKGAGSQNNEVTKLLTKIGPSIAYVSGQDANGAAAVGSGFVVTSNQNESWVITNFHLVAGSAASKGTVKVRLGNSQRDATVWSWDDHRDLALVILKTGNLPVLEWAAGDPAIGSQIWAVGTGAGRLQAAASLGHLADVSAEALLVDAGIASSSTGGPVLDNDGKVIGVLSNSYAPAGFPAASGWAVPIRLSCQKVVRCPS
ncbi:MAG: trypsin-like peptidase domain-containing protein [Actinomycetota bacterium]|nr:serine protease [Actinomycetota bacterium]